MNQRETFILKLMRIQQQQGWRVSFSLRNIKSDEVQIFGSAEELAAFLAGDRQQPCSDQQSDE